MNETVSQSDSSAKGKPRRARRWLKRGAIVIAILLVALQLVAKFVIGLGDPPLSISDPQIEYLFKPNQTNHRFHNLIHYNAYSMRSDDFPKTKADPNELRILMIGDSVINGGAQTDQAELASSIVQRELAAALHRPVVVGNISAASWGPPNQLAYVEKFGLFDADIVVIVESSHDVGDVRTFAPVVGVEPSMPDEPPLCAGSELITRYAYPFVYSRVKQRIMKSDAPLPPMDKNASSPSYTECLGAIARMIEMSQQRGARVILLQHFETTELEGTLLPGHDLIRATAQERGVPTIDLGPAFRASRDAGKNPYRDEIHPNAIGQRLIADAMLEPLRAAAAPTTKPAENDE